MRYLSIILLCFLSSCYGFKGISIPPDINTFYVEDFENRAPNAPGGINQTFSETLRTKIRNESKLTLVDRDADITFAGYINRYSISSEAPQEGNTVAFNKLTISVSVEYTDAADEDKSWTQSFSFFKDFDATLDFQSEQDGFIEEIFTQIADDLFNKAFTNW